MASKRDPQFPDITDISPLQYYHLLEQGHRPTRSQLAKLRSDNPVHEKPSKPEVPLKRKSSASASEAKKKLKREDEPLPPIPSDKEEEIDLNYLTPVSWGLSTLGRSAFLRSPDGLLPVTIINVIASPTLEVMPARYCVQHSGSIAETWVDLRSDQLLLGGEVVCTKEDSDHPYQIVARPGGPLGPESVPVVGLLDHKEANYPSQSLKLCFQRDHPAAAEAIELYQSWLRANPQVRVTPEKIPDYQLRFVAVKTRKETKTGLLLRCNPQTGKVFLYIGTKLKWERLENCEISGSLADPSVPVQLLSTFAYESDLRKAYKAFYRKESVEMERKLRDEGVFRRETRCVACKYILDELEYRECGRCGECRHLQCIDEGFSAIPLRGTWRCPNCPRCENCFSELGKFFRCKACNSCFHEKCVDLLLAPTPSKNWKCENCAVCQFCGVRAAQHSVKWNDAITMCHPCETKWKKREYCPVCSRFWYFEGDRLSEHVDPLILLESQNMIQCDKCQMWIHMKCDLNVTQEELALYAVAGNAKKYFCPGCTVDKKNDDMVKLIKELTSLDPQEFFHHYVDDFHYNKVIKQQMCFDQMLESAKAGLYANNPTLLKDHFKLICDNAMCYYKTNANGYVTAQKLLKDGLELLQKRLSLPSPKKKPTESRVPKPKKATIYLEKQLLSLHIPLPTHITKPDSYDFETDRFLTLAPISFQPPNDYFKLIIMKKDIQPYLKTCEKPAFYLMGMAIAYTDQRLNWVELCCLCSSFVRDGEAWVCRICGRAFHGFCLEIEKGQDRGAWKCRDCRVCEICSGTSDFSKLIYCSDCGKAYDTACLWPHLADLPPIFGWKCDSCFLCVRCGSKSFLNGHSPDELQQIAPDQDFSKCYQCFWTLANKQYCPVCEEDWCSAYNRDGEVIKEKLTCKHCGFGFHRTCLEGPWKGGCAACLGKNMDFAEAEQTTIQQVQTLMELVSQINFYKSLCKDGVEKHYNLPPEFAKMLSNFFLIDNSEFMSSNRDIKRLFQYRGVEIVKKQSNKEAGYKTTTLPLFQGLRRSDIPTASIPEIRLHSPSEFLPLYSLSWDTSCVISSLPKFWSPLDSFSIVHDPSPAFPRDPGLFSTVREIVWDFGAYTPIANPCDFDKIINGTCYWWALETELHPGSVSVIQSADELISLSVTKTGETHVDVLTEEIDPEMLATQYVNHEVPTAIAFTAKFERWLRSTLVKLTLHILNRNRNERPSPPAIYSPRLPDASQSDATPVPVPRRPASRLRSIADSQIPGDQTTGLVCVFCKQAGEREVSGRLLPSEEGLWAHVSCGYWSMDVEFLQDCGGLLNFSQALTRGKKSKCSHCGILGATLICSYKKCHNHYHFPCALVSEVRFFEPKTVVCKHCPLTKEFISKSQLDGEELALLTHKKWTFTTGKRYARKPPFVRNQFNRTGALILREIPEIGVHEQLESYRLTWLQGRRTLIHCSKKDNFFKISDAFSSELIASSETIEDLWPALKLGDSFYLRCAADFFGYPCLSNYLPPCPETASYFRNIKEKKPKTLLEILNGLKSPEPGASLLLAFDKHRFRMADRVKSRNTKSTHFEDTEVGHKKDDLTLASEYRKYKKTPNRDEHLEVLSSPIHGLGLFTTVE